MWNRAYRKLFTLVLLTMAFVQSAMASCPATGDPRFDPCPDQDNFVLPMPGDLKMVFRKVIVPGKDFWADSRRIIQVGDPQGDIFQGQQRVMVGGAFHETDSDHWYYYLGKYEVSKAQFAAVVGKGDIMTGVKRLAELSGDPDDKALIALSGDRLYQALAYPVTWVTWLTVQEFINDYNKWCYADTACQEALPTLKAKDDKEPVPGFFRLPTELEWEYAGRGGLDAEDFNAELPFERQQYDKYAFVQPKAKSKPRRIGTLDPVYGFHDMFGNVQELTTGLFQAEMGQGKAGALVARGGSYLSRNSEIRSSYRSEVGFYQFQGGQMMEMRSPTTGFRLAVASPVIPTSKYRTQIEQEHADYVAQIRNQTPAGQSLVNSGIQANNTVQTAQMTLSSLVGQTQDPQLQRELERIKAELEKASRNLELRNQEACTNYVKHGVIFSNLFVRSYRDSNQKENLIRILSQKQEKSASDQANLAVLTEAAAHERGQMDFYFSKYLEELRQLSGCGDRLAQNSLESFKTEITQGRVSLAEKEAFNLLREHFNAISRNTAEPNAWRAQIIEVFREKQLLMQL